MIVNLDRAVRSVHQVNIDRYRWLLTTPLTVTERQFVERRIAEEQEALRKASALNPPLDLAMD